jgi:hypothetical protein
MHRMPRLVGSRRANCISFLKRRMIDGKDVICGNRFFRARKGPIAASRGEDRSPAGNVSRKPPTAIEKPTFAHAFFLSIQVLVLDSTRTHATACSALPVEVLPTSFICMPQV